jgi:integrase
MTGTRRGEILGLRWADVDLDSARLSVSHAVVAVAYDVLESTPKSHNARVIDLDQETVELLRIYRRQQQDERVEWGADYQDHDLVACWREWKLRPPSLTQPDFREDRQASGYPEDPS